VEPGQIVHHLTHLWFQANATPRTAHESYLRSAFANYGDLLWLEAAEGVAARDRYMEYWYDQLDGRTEPPADPTDATGNEALFARGPLSLHALRILVGDETFFEILRAWVVRYHRGSPTVDDFVGLAEELSDRPLDDWERGWLRDETVPPATEIGLPAP
jgi:aminopeptidase N